MQLKINPHRPFRGSRRGKPHAPAPAASHELITQFDSLIVLTEGVIDLSLYELIRSAANRQGPHLKEILIDLSRADTLTESGCATLIALDEYASQRNLLTFFVGAGSDIRSRAQGLCSRVRWID